MTGRKCTAQHAISGLPAAAPGLGSFSFLIPIAAGLMLTACAKAPTAQGFLGNGKDAKAPMETAQATPDKAAEIKTYWARAYANNPKDENAAVAYARVLKREDKDKAMSVLQQAAITNPDSKVIASEQGRLALDMGQTEFAEKLIARAEDPAKPDWRLVSAKGTLAAKRGDNKGALALFQRAEQLAPTEASVLNNLALAYALEGQPAKAEPLLKRAIAAGGDATKVRQNLALVLGVQGKFDEAKQVAAVDTNADSAAQNDAYLRKMVKATPIQLAKAPAAAPAPVLAAAQPLRGSTEPAPAAPDWNTAVAKTAQK
jgi:Flp pilus assembly protein TadD